LLEISGAKVRVHGGKGGVLNVFASAVARAIIGAGCARAGLAFVAIKALAFAGVTIADTTVSAFGVLMEKSLAVGRVNPGDFERANTLRAIARIVRKADTVVVVALADVVSQAGAMAAALIIASGLDVGNQRKNY